MQKDIEKEHAGVNDETVHAHHDPAKYVMPPNGKKDVEWSTTTPTSTLIGELTTFVWHDGADVEGRHRHTYRVKAAVNAFWSPTGPSRKNMVPPTKTMKGMTQMRLDPAFRRTEMHRLL